MDPYAAFVHTLATIGDDAGLATMLDNDPTLANHPDEFRFASIPLHWACMNGHLHTSELLLDRGARLNAANTLGMTALMTASFEGHAEVVKMLMSRGADPMGTVILSNMSALGAAAVAGHVEVVKVFLAYLPMHQGLHTQLALAFLQACMRGQEAVARTLLPEPDLARTWPRGSVNQILRTMRTRGYNGCAQLLKWFHDEVGRWHCVSKVWHLHDEAQTLRHVAGRDSARTRGGTRSARLSAASELLRGRLLVGQALPSVELREEGELRHDLEEEQRDREGRRRQTAYGAKFATLQLLPERKRRSEAMGSGSGMGVREGRRLLAGIVLRHVVEAMDTHVFVEFMGYMRPG